MLGYKFPRPRLKLTPKLFTFERKITNNYRCINIFHLMTKPLLYYLITLFHMTHHVQLQKHLPHIITIRILILHSIIQRTISKQSYITRLQTQLRVQCLILQNTVIYFHNKNTCQNHRFTKRKKVSHFLIRTMTIAKHLLSLFNAF